MKEWNNPELLSLGIENTSEDSDLYANSHYCHALNNGKGGMHLTKDCKPGQTGDVKNNNCNNPKDSTCGWTVAQNSKCCCVAPTSVTPDS